MARKKKEYQLATIDIETDPFKKDRIPKPFCCELNILNGEYVQFWGEYCLYQLIEHLKEIDANLIMYAHNGGKFDFWYLLEWGVIDENIKLINGRLVKAFILDGKHQLRDSYSIIPIALNSYQKDVINYEWFEKENREKHKRDILDYLHSDCVYLGELIQGFWDRFGDVLTIGGASIKQLKEYHPFTNITPSLDELFRPYYFGGRVEFFERGELKGNFKVIDINSMYPYVMANYEHPRGISAFITSPTMERVNELIEDEIPFFIHYTGTNKHALPTRTKEGLNFNIEHGEFRTTWHEFNYCLKHDLISVDEIHQVIAFNETITFEDFVEEYVSGKIKAKLSKDKIGELFFKLILNSSYGKCGQNPDNYYDWKLIDLDEILPEGWVCHESNEYYEIWRRPADSQSFYDVAIATSVTSCARVVLLDALRNATRAVYCDTDSIICEDAKVDFHPTKLGAWDVEATGKYVAIAGKKLYAFKDDNGTWKTATKGVRLSADEIVRVTQGEQVQWENEAPSFKMTNTGATFIKRNIKMK